MAEKPKSIWKKPWRGTLSLLLAWAGLMVATLIIFWVIMLASGTRITSEELKLWAVLALCVTIAVFLVLFIRWLFCWRNFKRFIFGCACLATLIALFYAEEDWRGKHDWEKFKREWEAKGEKFDFANFVPPPAPDDQNFAMAPIWVESVKATLGGNARRWKYPDDGRTNFTDWLQMEIYHSENSHSFNVKIENPKIGDWEKGELTDLLAWQRYYRMPSYTNAGEFKSPFRYPAHTFTNGFPMSAQPQSPAADVLLALSKYDSPIEELRQASQLPYSRFPLNYDEEDPAVILLPHLAALKRSSQVLQLRAIAELQNGQSEKALEDVKLSLRLIDSIRSEPFLISHLVRIAIFQIALQPVYEGLAEHKWSDAQLVELDSELSKFDFLADCQFSARGERALEVGIIEFVKHAPIKASAGLFSDIYSESQNDRRNFTAFSALVYAGPQGWFYQNELSICKFNIEWYLPIVNESKRTVSPAAAQAAKNAFEQVHRHWSPENMLELWLLPASENGVKKFAFAQSSADLARVAIALERYRLSHGNFPDSLDALAPQFMEKIPHDIIGGPPSQSSGATSQPLKYRRTDDGQFVLYSIGWNETDDGGVVMFKNGSPPRDGWKAGIDMDKGDWVWRYPAR